MVMRENEESAGFLLTFCRFVLFFHLARMTDASDLQWSIKNGDLDQVKAIFAASVWIEG